LDADRSGEGPTAHRDSSIDTEDLVGEQIELHSPLYGDIDFSTDLPTPAPVMCGDRGAIARAIGNLISNAGKYAQTRVVVSITESENQIHFTVDDDGPGITEADRESIFEPFKRLSESNGRRSNRNGTGLGLALVKRIAEGNGGSIEIEDSQLGGSRFVFVLPLASNDGQL
jgi:two-component system sensor histidine kinase RstB